MNQKGFTLMGQIVAIGLAVLGMGIVAPMLLSHFADGKTAALGETLNNSQVAFQSFYVDSEGLLTDTDADGDYFDDLVTAGFMSRVPQDTSVAYTIQVDTDMDDDATDNGIAYYVRGVYANTAVTTLEARLNDLDEKIDNDNGPDAGILQWNEGTQGTTDGEFYFLLYSEEADVADAAWHEAL